MKILQGCTAILTLLGIGAENNARINSRNIPRTLLRFNIFVPLLIYIYLAYVFCKNNSVHSVGAILMPIAIAATCFFQVTVYGSLLMKTKEIDELMDFFERVVNKRNQLIIFLIVLPQVFGNFTF